MSMARKSSHYVRLDVQARLSSEPCAWAFGQPLQSSLRPQPNVVRLESRTRGQALVVMLATRRKLPAQRCKRMARKPVVDPNASATAEP